MVAPDPPTSTPVRRARRWVLLALLLLVPGSVSAQHYRFRVLGTVDGMPQIQALAVFQDSAGYIWLGTYGGAARYNGASFTSFHAAHGLPASTVTALGEVPGDGVVIGTLAGVAVFRDDEIVPLREPAGLVGVVVNRFLADADGTLWIATESGLWELASGTLARLTSARGADDQDPDAVRRFGAESGLPDDDVRTVFRDRAGRLWAGTANGLAVLDGGGFRKVAGTPSGVQVNGIAEDRDGSLWVATQQGIYHGSPDRGAFDRLRSPEPEDAQAEVAYAALVDDDGVVWVGTQAGAIRVQGPRVELISADRGLPSDNVYDIHQDRESNLWFGTDAGAARLTPGPFVALTTSEGLSHDFVRAIEEDADGRVWLGTRDGVTVREPDGSLWTLGPADGLLTTRTFGIAVEPGGSVLLGTSGGVYRWRGTVTARFTTEHGLPSDLVRDIVVTRDGTAWVGTRYGVVRLEGSRILPAPDPGFERLGVVDMVEDDRGRLWIGSYREGLHVWDGSTLTSAGLEGVPIWSIASDGAGGVWVGTNGRGLYRFSDAGDDRLSEDDGLVNDFVWQALLDRRGHLWAYTNRGLDRWDGERFFHYDQEDGLLDLEGSAHAILEDSRGHLWFGTGHGVMRYLPERERELASSVPPLVRIERVEGLESGDAILDGDSVDRGRNSFAFSFAGLTYRNEGGTVFRYRLVGLDDDWSKPTRERRISYATLSPGLYRFEVEAGTKAGVWSEAPASFSFRVEPGWYETGWSRAGAGLLALLTMLGVSWLRTKHLARDRERLTREVEARTDELLEQRRHLAEAEASSRAKTDFLARMSHEIRTPLNGVLGMTQLLTRTETSAKQRRYLESARQSGAALLHVVNDVLDMSKIEAGKLDLEHREFDPWDALREVVEMFGADVQAKQVELVCDVGQDLPASVVGDPTRISQVLINLMSNAVKFTDQGQITASMQVVDQTDETVELRYEVRDSGAGIPHEMRDTIFESFRQADRSTTRRFGGTGLGLAIARQLVELMGGELELESVVGVGSTFGFSLTLLRGDQATREPVTGDRTDSTIAGRRILIVDDNAVSRDVLEASLGACGLRTSAVERGDLALDAVAHAAACDDPYELALLDFNMPGMDGLEVARHLAEQRDIPRPRLVLLASVGVVVEPDEAAACGIDRYLQRPIRPAALRRVVRELLTGADAAEPEIESQDHQPVEPLAARILLAEDNVVNRDVAAAMLEEFGCTLELAHDGREAVEKAASADYDMIFMDCEMPGLDGFQATREIRQLGGRRGAVPIVALTANALATYRDLCLEAGMNDYQSKPYVSEQLAEMVARWAGEGADGSAASRSPVEGALAVLDPSACATDDAGLGAAATLPSVLPDDHDDEPTLDEAVLDQIRRLDEGSPGLLRRVIANYVNSSEGLLRELEAASTGRSAADVRLAAHSLKSCSSTVGAQRVARCCEAIESAAESGRTEVPMDELRRERDAACEALLELRAA